MLDCNLPLESSWSRSFALSWLTLTETPRSKSAPVAYSLPASTSFLPRTRPGKFQSMSANKLRQARSTSRDLPALEDSCNAYYVKWHNITEYGRWGGAIERRSGLTTPFAKIRSPAISVLPPARRPNDDTEVKRRRNAVNTKCDIFILYSKKLKGRRDLIWCY